MKKIFFALLLIFIPKLFFGQSSNDKTIYLDSLFHESKNDEYTYSRTIVDYYLPKESYQINDYYKSGKIEKEGNYLDKDGFKRNGLFTFYYENGNKKETINFEKSLPLGANTTWYENGNKRLEADYIPSEDKTVSNVFLVKQFWDEKNIQKVIDSKGDFEEIEKNFHANGKIKNGLKDGIWTGVCNNFKLKYKFTEEYADGKLISGTSIDTDGVSYNYQVVELHPEPQNGIDGFYKYIAKNYQVPSKAKVTGKLYFSFIIEKDGSIQDVKAIRDLGFGTAEEGIRVLQNCPNWKPALLRGIKVSCSYNIPISIQSIDID